MDDFLTTKQLQDLLKVDRITIYRMLNDGRLKGTKIGQQWRFALKDVEALLSGACPPEILIPPGGYANFPMHCVQAIQNVFAEIGQVGAVTVDPTGEPLTELSHTCSFCKLIQSSPAGHAACRESWGEIARSKSEPGVLFTCHAGLTYARGALGAETTATGWLLGGQCHVEESDPREEKKQVNQIAQRYGLDPSKLEEAARDIPVLDGERRLSIAEWPEKVAVTINSILVERAGLMDRLQKIAEISNLATN